MDWVILGYIVGVKNTEGFERKTFRMLKDTDETIVVFWLRQTQKKVNEMELILKRCFLQTDLQYTVRFILGVIVLI